MRNFSNLSLNNTAFIKALIIGVASSVITIALTLCIITAIFTASAMLPYEYLEYIMLIPDAIGVLAGGYIAARINKSNGLFIGLCNGAIVFLALIISGFCITPETLTLITLLKAVVILLFSAFGGIKGVNVKEKIRIK